MDKNADEKPGIKTAGATPGFQRTQRRSSRRTGRWVGSSVRSGSSSRAERKSENRESAVEFLRGAEDGLVSEPMWGNEGQDELVSEVEWGSGERDISGNYLDEDIVVGETSGDLASAVSEAGEVRDVAGEDSGLSRERGFYNEKKDSGELKKAEDETKVGKGASGLNKKEESGAGRIPFTGGQNAGGKKKEKKKGFFKGKGPVVAIVGLIAGAVGLALSTLSLMPFALTELATELYDQAYTSRTARLPKLVKYVFNLENDETEVTKKVRKIFGDDYVKYRKSALRHKNGLASQGIEIVGSGKNKQLEWTHEKWDTDPSDGQYKLMKITETITADDYGAKYASDVDFRNSFNKGTRSFTGRIAGWIDLSAAKFFDKFSITKTLFSGWIESVAKREGDAEFLETIKARKKDLSMNESVAVRQEEEPELDDDGNPIIDADGNTKTKTSPKVKKALDVAGTINDIAQAATSAVCGTAAIAATLTGIKAVITVQNAINFAQAGNEAVQKTKFGDGTESPTNTYANMLTTRDNEGNYPLLAQGLLYIVSGGTHKVEMDAATMSANIEELYKSWGTSIGAVVGCTIAQGFTALFSFVVSVAEALTGPVGWTAMAIQTAVGVVFSVGLSATVAVAVERIAASITSDQCTGETEGLDEGVNASLAMGACLATGMSAEMSRNALLGGSSPGDSGMVEENENARAIALAYEAEYDRANYSPFDVTNKNTFFGSLARTVATSLSTFAGNGSLMSLASGMSTMAASSFSALVPGANAAIVAENKMGDCPGLQSIGMQGYADGSCNPIAVNDMGMMDYDPEENLVEIAETYGGFEMDGGKVKVSGGVEQIDEKSNLGKYIDYCVNRESPYGTIDQTIMDAETPASTGNSTADAALSALPFVGDLIDAYQSGSLLTSEALGWASGATCGAKDGDNASATSISISTANATGNVFEQGFGELLDATYQIKVVPWDEIKHYAQYVTDDKIMETADPENYNSAVMAYIEKQEEKNPVDNSFEGWLARRTGQRKETIAYALNEVKYWTYVADYDATDKYPRVEKQKEFQIQEVMPDEMEMPGGVLAKREQNVVYEDLRRVVIG